MKGLSICFTILLLVLANQLAVALRQMGATPVHSSAATVGLGDSAPSAKPAPVQLHN